MLVRGKVIPCTHDSDIRHCVVLSSTVWCDFYLYQSRMQEWYHICTTLTEDTVYHYRLLLGSRSTYINREYLFKEKWYHVPTIRQKTLCSTIVNFLALDCQSALSMLVDQATKLEERVLSNDNDQIANYQVNQRASHDWDETVLDLPVVDDRWRTRMHRFLHRSGQGESKR